MTPHMDPEYSHRGVSSALFPPTEYYVHCVPGKREEPSQQQEVFPGDTASRRRKGPWKNPNRARNGFDLRSHLGRF